MSDSKRKKITIFVNEELHKPARTRIAELDTSFQQVLTNLLEQWVAGGAAAPKPLKTSPYSEANRKWHELLEMVLASSSERRIIEKNLEWAVSALGTKTVHSKRVPQ